ncbi:MAG: GTP-binding protein, partial [Thermoleophilia bacterium]|nr:GTP-binding protein [Thermoleophilia bacterium]
MKGLPIIAVVGSPNAGKSTLVNRLSGTRTTVVHETPGVTRDRKEVEIEWTGHRLLFVDTGGYDTTEDALFAGHIREQVEHAIATADVVLFVLDGRAGPLADDYGIAEVLRRSKVPVVVVANKIDDPAATSVAAEI